MREADAMVVRRVGNRHGCVVAVLIYAVSVLTVPPKLGLWLCRNCCVFVAMHLPSHAVTFLKETMTQGWKATVVLGFSVFRVSRHVFAVVGIFMHALTRVRPNSFSVSATKERDFSLLLMPLSEKLLI